MAHAQTPDTNETATAIFAGGCFWCLESELESAQGIVSVTSGYTGGRAEDANYEKVSTKKTGHYEAVEVVYYPGIISYEALLGMFWSNVDPLDAGGQYADRGPQYRTAIFYANAQEKTLAEASKARMAEKIGQPVVTEILPQQPFYAAEAYHQDYAKKNPERYRAYKYGSGRRDKP